MKKFLFLIVSCLCIMGVTLANDTPTGMTISLKPGWNVVSTPTVLSNILFSNGGDGISFMYLDNNEWKNAVITPSNVHSIFKPLEGFLVKNNNSYDVNMVLYYDMNIDVSGVMREKEVRAGWNFLGITKTLNPFQNIVSTDASIIVDFTKKFYNGASVSYMKENPSEYEIGKAYGIFADKNGIYGGLTAFLTNVNCDEPNTVALCSVDSVDCPKECQTPYNEVTGIKLQNTNLGTINVTKGLNNAIISEGTILVEKAVTIPSFSITANTLGIDSLIFIANGNEYTATSTDNLTFTFENVQIAKSGKVKFKANISQNAELNSTINLSTINADTIQSAKFTDNNEQIDRNNIAGTISFSQLYVNTPKASIQNNISTNVSFPLNNTISKVVYDGTYTAKFGDIYINNIQITSSSILPNSVNIDFELYIDNVLVADFSHLNTVEYFDDLKIAAGDSANVKIYAVVDAHGESLTLPTLTLQLGGRDINGDSAGNVSDTLVDIKVVDGSKVGISDASYNNVQLSKNDAVIAQFTVKPTEIDESVIEEVSFDLDLDGTDLDVNDIKFTINGEEYEAEPNQGFTYEPDINVDNVDGVIVKIYLKSSRVGTVTLQNLKINNNTIYRTFKNKYEHSIAWISSQKDLGGTTQFTMNVEKISNATVSNLKIYSDATGEHVINYNHDFEDGDTFEAIGEKDYAQMIERISFDVTEGSETHNVDILKADYNDYFKIGDTYARIYKAN